MSSRVLDVASARKKSVWLAGLAHYRRGKPQRWARRGTAYIIEWPARGGWGETAAAQWPALPSYSVVRA